MQRISGFVMLSCDWQMIYNCYLPGTDFFYINTMFYCLISFFLSLYSISLLLSNYYIYLPIYLTPTSHLLFISIHVVNVMFIWARQKHVWGVQYLSLIAILTITRDQNGTFCTCPKKHPLHRSQQHLHIADNQPLDCATFVWKF